MELHFALFENEINFQNRVDAIMYEDFVCTIEQKRALRIDKIWLYGFLNKDDLIAVVNNEISFGKNILHNAM